MCQTVLHDNFQHLSRLLPQFLQLGEQESVMFPMPVMNCQVSIKQKGISVIRLEIAFCDMQGKPDHKMQVKLNLADQTAEPESIWFKCRGTTKVRVPKIGIDPAIMKVQSNTLRQWLESVIQSSH